jgi:hypothetical protein
MSCGTLHQKVGDEGSIKDVIVPLTNLNKNSKFSNGLDYD